MDLLLFRRSQITDVYYCDFGFQHEIEPLFAVLVYVDRPVDYE
jgi:hypothetical protein